MTYTTDKFDVQFAHVQVAAQTPLGAVVLWQVTGGSGELLGSGKAASLSAAGTAAMAIVNANAIGGL